MPKRLIDDSLLSSPSLAKCSPRAQDAFPRFILLADDFGCFEVEPRALVGRGWPKRTDVSEDDVRAFLDEYVAAGMACLYTAQERRCCYLTGWNGPHGQKKRAEYDPNAPAGTPGRHGSKRRLPAPPPDLVAAVVAGARRDADGKPPGTDREDTPETPSDSGPAREMAGSRSIPGPVPPVPAAVPEFPGPVVPDPDPDPVADAPVGTPALLEADSPVAISLPCVGSARSYGVTLAQVARWQVDFPAVDVMAELGRARAWLEANPVKRKTHGGTPRFLVSWFGRAQDKPQLLQPKRATEAAAPHAAFKGGKREFV